MNRFVYVQINKYTLSLYCNKMDLKDNLFYVLNKTSSFEWEVNKSQKTYIMRKEFNECRNINTNWCETKR